jgi:hypothetical protein
VHVFTVARLLDLDVDDLLEESLYFRSSFRDESSRLFNETLVQLTILDFFLLLQGVELLAIDLEFLDLLIVTGQQLEQIVLVFSQIDVARVLTVSLTVPSNPVEQLLHVVLRPILVDAGHHLENQLLNSLPLSCPVLLAS